MLCSCLFCECHSGGAVSGSRSLSDLNLCNFAFYCCIHSCKHLFLEVLRSNRDHISISMWCHDPSGSWKHCVEFHFLYTKYRRKSIWLLSLPMLSWDLVTYIKDCWKRRWSAKLLEKGVNYFYFLKGRQVKYFELLRNVFKQFQYFRIYLCTKLDSGW